MLIKIRSLGRLYINKINVSKIAVDIETNKVHISLIDGDRVIFNTDSLEDANYTADTLEAILNKRWTTWRWWKYHVFNDVIAAYKEEYKKGAL